MTDKIAVVTGASTGLGYQLARFAAEDGYSLIICADEEKIHEAADKLRRLGAEVEPMVVDLATRHGVDSFWQAIADREIDLFFANAGRALGEAFHDQDWAAIKRRIDLNLLQTTSLLHRVGRKMHARGSGRILVTGSIGGFVPGPYDAVYNATKAYLDSFCYALQDEWKDGPVTLTCLMPGPTETEVFDRPENDLADAPIAESQKDDPVEVARAGYDAMMRGERGVVPGVTSKILTMLAGVVPQSILARVHRAGAKPE
ncbi:SDR family NAD(P)-dependent oxidoreductase [Profundibacterium mesophilum]|uniref:3-oxoacyl-acyl-carrier protein reductase n=1 Tax=Profundibacterium mesophilum KAUST100406-0324 TaxID=1037889 RepID=A0A921TCI9_9RHOB|nr:SDR family NAD(P)-dependent oxidoreductase [Profundibacterium mesophilum]KAF0677160.1 3-oxoacyl-acyl-carrier protein reductase [Profundibacterium mesophilum KAUST100406-0324]